MLYASYLDYKKYGNECRFYQYRTRLHACKIFPLQKQQPFQMQHQTHDANAAASRITGAEKRLQSFSLNLIKKLQKCEVIIAKSWKMNFFIYDDCLQACNSCDDDIVMESKQKHCRMRKFVFTRM